MQLNRTENLSAPASYSHRTFSFSLSKNHQQFQTYFPTSSRYQNVIASRRNTDQDSSSSTNVLTKEALIDVMKLHESIESGISIYDGKEYTYTDLCTVAGG